MMFDYHEAIREMHKGNVVKYIGTENGPVWTDKGCSFCMCRGCIFVFKDGIKWNMLGHMIYDPDFRYELTGQTVDTRAWKPEKNKDRKEIKSKMWYSRIGLGNV
jgi:hypothetical protein